MYFIIKKDSLVLIIYVSLLCKISHKEANIIVLLDKVKNSLDSYTRDTSNHFTLFLQYQSTYSWLQKMIVMLSVNECFLTF